MLTCSTQIVSMLLYSEWKTVWILNRQLAKQRNFGEEKQNTVTTQFKQRIKLLSLSQQDETRKDTKHYTTKQTPNTKSPLNEQQQQQQQQQPEQQPERQQQQQQQQQSHRLRTDSNRDLCVCVCVYMWVCASVQACVCACLCLGEGDGVGFGLKYILLALDSAGVNLNKLSLSKQQHLR